MKQLTGKLLFIVLICVTACKKDTENDNTQLKHDLAGSWELSKAYVSIIVIGGVIAYEPGNCNIIMFGTDGHLSQTVVNADTTYTITGKYLTQPEDNCGINLLTTLDSSNGAYNYHAYVHLDSLIMSAGNCIADASSYIYLRKK